MPLTRGRSRTARANAPRAGNTASDRRSTTTTTNHSDTTSHPITHMTGHTSTCFHRSDSFAQLVLAKSGYQHPAPAPLKAGFITRSSTSPSGFEIELTIEPVTPLAQSVRAVLLDSYATFVLRVAPCRMKRRSAGTEMCRPISINATRSRSR